MGRAGARVLVDGLEVQGRNQRRMIPAGNGVVGRSVGSSRSAFRRRGEAVTRWLGIHLPDLKRLLKRIWPVAAWIIVLMVILQGYSLFRKTYFQRPAEVAFANALEIIDLQRALGMAVTSVEIPLQQRVLEHPWLIDFFNTYYRQFKPALYICAALCVLLAPAAFRRGFGVFLITTLIAFPWYAIYPLAPPRLMEPYGYPFVDTLAVFGGAEQSAAGLGGANQFAAMPSMHIGWTTIAAFWLAAALPWRRIGLALGIAHLALMCVTVVVTGNHYVLDIIAGFAVVGAAVVVARILPSINVSYIMRRAWPGSATRIDRPGPG